MKQGRGFSGKAYDGWIAGINHEQKARRVAVDQSQAKGGAGADGACLHAGDLLVTEHQNGGAPSRQSEPPLGAAVAELVDAQR